MFQDYDKYNQLVVVNGLRTKNILEEYNKYLNYGDEELILDIGSGTGVVTTQVLLPCIPQQNFRLIGIDISKHFVEYANNSNIDSRVSFRVLDISEKSEQKLKSVFKDEELKSGFDKVFSFSVVSWIKDYEQCFKNIYSLMKPGGQTLIWFFGYFTFSDVWESVIRKTKWQPFFKDEPVFRFPLHDSKDAKEECSTILKRIGFQVTICDCLRQKQVTDLSSPWRVIMQMANPYYHRIPEPLQSDYLDDCMETFYQLHEVNGGFPCDLIVFVASKPKA